jgi:hypothetical protein
LAGRFVRRAIIHIGTPKTGTTSIQRVLGLNRAALPAQGACYPLSPGALEHVRLHAMLVHRRTLLHGAPSQEEPHGAAVGIEQFPDDFAKEMDLLPAGVKRVILSEERLSVFRFHDDLAALKSFLAPYFDEFTIVVYLRSQDSYLASRYAELLRMGVLEGPDHVVATAERLAPYDYLALIERWAAVFGPDAMVPRIYERGADSIFDSVDDFLAVCGVCLPVPADDPSRLRNKSMSFAGQQLMLRIADLARQETGDDRLRAAIWFEVGAAVSQAMPGGGWLPTRTEAAAFMARFAAGNEIIRQRFFPDRQRLFADGSARFPVEPMSVSEKDIGDAACLAFLKATARAAAKERPAPRPIEDQAERQRRRAARRERNRQAGVVGGRPPGGRAA